jgi:hypothetical protein
MQQCFFNNKIGPLHVSATQARPTNYRWPIVKEQKNHGDSQRDFNRSKIILFLTRHILKTSVLTLKTQHMRVIHVKSFLWSVVAFWYWPSLAETYKWLYFIFKKQTLNSMDFNFKFAYIFGNFTYQILRGQIPEACNIRTQLRANLRSYNV